MHFTYIGRRILKINLSSVRNLGLEEEEVLSLFFKVYNQLIFTLKFILL
jgi:hypothetical protein